MVDVATVIIGSVTGFGAWLLVLLAVADARYGYAILFAAYAFVAYTLVNDSVRAIVAGDDR
jgi:hypothetical protein